MQSAGIVEYYVIGFYLIFMVLTGILSRKFVSGFGDYFRSGSKGSWWMVGSSIFMSSFSAWTFTGAAGVAYLSGITVSIIFLANTFGYLTNWLFTAHLFRQMRATTFTEVIRARFNTTTQQVFYVWLGAIPGIMMASLTLVAVATFTSAVFGFDIYKLIIILGLVVMVYSTIGGSWSVFATDFLQTLILMPMAVLVTVLSLNKIGGISGLLQKIHEQGHPELLQMFDMSGQTQFTPSWAVAFFLYVFMAYNSFGSSVKYFSVKDGNEAKKAALLSAILMLVGSLIWFIPPIVARLEFAELITNLKIQNPHEASYGIIAMKLLPQGLVGLIVVAMFSATMSSLNTTLNQTAAIITQDVYGPFKGMFSKKPSDRELFIVGQIASMITGILIIFSGLYFAQYKDGIFQAMLDLGGRLGTPTLIPMFLALFIRKTPPWSAFFSIICSLTASSYCYYTEQSYAVTIYTLTLVGSLSFISTCYFWRFCSDEYKARVEAFYSNMKKPVDFRKEVGKTMDSPQLLLLGFLSVCIGGFILLLAIIPDTLSGKIQTASLAGSMILLGSLLLIAGNRRKEKELEANQIIDKEDDYCGRCKDLKDKLEFGED